ncbi:MAG: sulfotransferase [Gemmatimonadetes bacterium]|nr:sulfotransferase [Gemmatimonadota bacterium]MBK9067606.1 sulfotransferase [Gemmatimonadota bacterium]
MTEPFFLVGFQRSGTTLLRLMLDNHPEIAIPLDTVGLWARYEDRLADFGHLTTDDDARRLVDALLGEERIRLWQTPLGAEAILSRRRYPGYPGIIDAFHLAYAAAQGKRLWGDKDPGNMERIDRLHRWFPECRILHIIRDGRDACLSQQQQDFGIQDLFECAECWREQVEWVRRLGVVLGSRYLEIRYEDLLEDPAGQLQRVCGFLGVAWAPAMLEYHRHVDRSVPEEKKGLWPLLNQPPRKDNAGRWKVRLTEGQRIGFEKRAWSVLTAMGYETYGRRPSGGYGEEVLRTLRRLRAAMARRLGARR